MKYKNKNNLNIIKFKKSISSSTIDKSSLIKLFIREFRHKKAINYSFLFLFIIINLIIPVFLKNIIRIKIIESGEAGKLLNQSFFPNEMIINNESTKFTNIIIPKGQNIELIWNRDFTMLDGMFYNYDINYTNSIIEEIDLSDFNTYYVKSMRNMFLNQTNLKYINMNGTQTINVKDFYSMFQNCTSLEYIDLSSFQFHSEVRYMSYMFWNCHKLEYIIFPSYYIYINNNFYMDNMFGNCYKLESIDLSNFIINYHASFKYMFYFDISLRIVKLPIIRKTTYSINMLSMFDSCSNVTSIAFYGDIFRVRDTSKMFNNCTSLISLDLSKFNTTYLQGVSF